MDAIVTSVLADIPVKTTFTSIHFHMAQTGVTDNHIYLLIKAVARNYLKIRLLHIAKEFNQKMLKHDRVRKKLSKLLLFKNQ